MKYTVASAMPTEICNVNKSFQQTDQLSEPQAIIQETICPKCTEFYRWSSIGVLSQWLGLPLSKTLESYLSSNQIKIKFIIDFEI